MVDAVTTAWVTDFDILLKNSFPYEDIFLREL